VAASYGFEGRAGPFCAGALLLVHIGQVEMKAAYRVASPRSRLRKAAPAGEATKAFLARALSFLQLAFDASEVGCLEEGNNFSDIVVASLQVEQK
jgi:hypothetical protein